MLCPRNTPHTFRQSMPRRNPAPRRSCGCSFARSQLCTATQDPSPGVGRVDFVVGERFVVEADSKAWHDGSVAFAEDRRRDLELHARGYIVLRLSYWQVINELDAAMAVIRSIVQRGEHLWAARHRRRGLGTGV